jgi:hypothetical protein
MSEASASQVSGVWLSSLAPWPRNSGQMTRCVALKAALLTIEVGKSSHYAWSTWKGVYYGSVEREETE